MNNDRTFASQLPGLPALTDQMLAGQVPAGSPGQFSPAAPQFSPEANGPGGGSGTAFGGPSWGAADPAELLEGLNAQQREAVEYAGGPLLVVAGAGSGKTRVLTHRIAYLLRTGRAQPGQILAITFTNKAAAEMRERVTQLVGPNAARMWVFTFHAACVRILRESHEAAGLRSTFSIYDTQDSQQLLNVILKDKQVDTKRFAAKMLRGRISDLKNELITAQQYAKTAPNDPISRVVEEVYPEYQRRLENANALDFDDLIMRTVQMLQSKPAVAQHYRRRFQHVLVDEYQDTNHAQYVLIRELIGADEQQQGELTVVGDSDQSIYAFRGATIRNIEEFEKDFPGAHTVLLEQNYRSTQNILSAANAVIAANKGRRAKNLWTGRGDGAPVVYDAANSEHDEARFVIAEIDKLTDSTYHYGDIAVFYRTNAQSRALEEMLVRSGIPYRVVGGTKFYERKEIKDALAYLASVSNPDDTVALRRILNTPRRGLGAKAEQTLVAHAAALNANLGDALRDAWVQAGCPRGEGSEIDLEETAWADAVAQEKARASGREISLTSRALKQAAGFYGLLVSLRTYADAGASIAELLDEAMEATGYLVQLRESEDPQDASRVENLAELHAVAADFKNTNPQGSLADFLERVSLVADSDQVAGAEDSGEVTLMTVHTAKGLEFPVVFVTGMEDGTFPHQRSLLDEWELSEERRLAYVAFTRAREKLYLTRAAVRTTWGTPSDLPPSRFLDDVPLEVLEVRRGSTQMDSYRTGGSGGSFGGFSNAVRGRGSFGGSSTDPWEDDFAPAIGSGGGLSARGFKRTGSRGPRAGMTSGTAGGGLKRLGVSKKDADKPKVALKIGDRVKHGSYGEGTVVGLEGAGASQVAKVDFGDAKPRRLLLRYAPIKKI